MSDSSGIISAGNRWTLDGALLFDSVDQALLKVLEGCGKVTNLWVLNPRLTLQKWAYHKSIPWFHLVEGLTFHQWRFPSKSILPSLMVVRYRPDFPFSAPRVKLKLQPLLYFCRQGNIPMLLDRQNLPPFLCHELDPWLTASQHQMALMQLYPISTGGEATYGALRGSAQWMEVLRGAKPCLQKSF